MDGDDVIATANRYLPPLVSLLLVILIGWLLARLVWMLVPAPAAGDIVVAPQGLASTGNSTLANANVKAIADAHLFGPGRCRRCGGRR